MKALLVARRDRLFVLAGGFLAGLVVAAGLDARLADSAAHAPRGLIQFGVAVSRIGLSGYMLILSALIVLAMPWAFGRPLTRMFNLSASALGERAAYFFAVIASSGLICQALKHVIGRARPRMLHQWGAYHFQGVTMRSGMESFPSGHTTTMFAAAFAFSLFFPRGSAGFYALAILVGIARVLALNHFPSDVVAGAALGTGVALWMTHVFAARRIAFSVTGTGVALKVAPPRAWDASA